MSYIGCHLSSAGGFLSMGQTAVSIGANTFAFFTRNPRGGSARPIDPADASALVALLGERGFGRLVAHAPYTLNPASATERTREFARQAMADDLLRMESLPGNYYNFHPGSHVGQGVERGIELIVETLDATLSESQSTTVLLETMSGKGSEIGGTFEQLASIISSTRLAGHLGVCLDTCHVSDAGYDIVGDLDGVLDEFDRVIGLGRLKALHLNDSLNPPGSHKDRHARIGEGSLGLGTFEAIMSNPRLAGLPMILETPNDLDGYAREIALLRSLDAMGA